MYEKPATLRDVAAAAEVSVSTASKVLNGRGRVATATRERIWETSKRLDFRPNTLAKSFATGRSLTVGVLTSAALRSFSMPVFIGGISALGSADMASLMYDARDYEPNSTEHIRRLQSRQVDGVLVIGEGLSERLRSVTAEFNVPVVYVFTLTDNPDDICFLPDSRMAGEIATTHLLQTGRRRIAHITSADDLAADQRIEGVEKVLEAAGLELVGGGPMRGDFTQTWGYEATKGLLESGEKFDAIFGGDDWIALGAQTALREAGVRIPDDVAVVGVDNLSSFVDSGSSFLSTVDPLLSNLGAAASQYLVGLIDGASSEAGVHYQECVLIPGASTLGLAKGDEPYSDLIPGV